MSPKSSNAASSRLNQVSHHLHPRKDTMSSADIFAQVPLAPPDSIFQLTAAYKADTFPQKVNLGVGAYRDNDGKPWTLPVVKKATEALLTDPTVDHEYLPITGLPEFTSAAAKLILGADSKAIAENRVASIQTISGTGANHAAALFLARWYDFVGKGLEPAVYLSNPTWANHHAIFSNVGIKPIDYAYYSPSTIGLDFPGLTSALKSAPKGSVFLLHACAHNPTGVDPTPEQWEQVANLFAERGLFALFDCAYQGFASGDLNRDAQAVRLFERRGIPLLVCQSFAKNAGLYGERVGALHIVGRDIDQTKRLFSQISVLQRSEISNPPAFGARLVARVLNSPELFAQWEQDISTMAGRIIDMRQKLRALLEGYGTPSPGGKGWKHVTEQIGMFSFTGLNPTQTQALVEKHHIYLTKNGRISMAGLNSHNVEYVAKAIDAVSR